jgi:hypothetical protein
VALFFALIVLVILLIGGVIVMHSINSSRFSAGNLAFRRDLVTQSDAVIAQAIQVISSAGSAGSCTSNTISDLTSNCSAANYSASVLPVNTQGIPNALMMSDDDFKSAGFTGADMAGSSNSGVAIRYVIERMCSDAGAAVPPNNCVRTSGNGGGGSNFSSYVPQSQSSSSVIYRLSYRVTGPRDTQAFFQTMFSGPG